MSDTILSKRVVFNPISMMTTTTRMVPICQYQSDQPTEDDQKVQRNAIIDTWSDEIIENGGEIAISNTSDVMITTQTEELYSDFGGWQDVEGNLTTKDIFFINVAYDVKRFMSKVEYNAYQKNILHNIARKYMDEGDQELEYVDYDRYVQLLEGLVGWRFRVYITTEESVYQQLQTAFPGLVGIIKSSFIINILTQMNLTQLSIGAHTDIRFQLFGFIKNIQPFVFLKDRSIYSMISTDTIDDMESLLTNPGFKLNMSKQNLLYRDIQSNTKKLMSVCKQTNLDYHAQPKGKMRQQMFDDTVDRFIISNAATSFQNNVQIKMTKGDSYVDYDLTINAESATNAVTSRATKIYTENFQNLTAPLESGFKSYKNTYTKTRYMTDYAVSIPITQTSMTKSQIIKFKEGPIFAAIQTFRKTPAIEAEITSGGTEALDAHYFQHPYLESLNTMVINVYGKPHSLPDNQPILSETDYADHIEKREKEMQQTQVYSYDTTHVETDYIFGDFLYMTKQQSHSSAAYMGLTVKIAISLPTAGELVNPYTWNITSYIDKVVTMKCVFSVQDPEDNQQIKDTIDTQKAQMQMQLFNMLENQARNDMTITNINDYYLTPEVRRKMLHFALQYCMVPLKFNARTVLYDEYLHKKQKALYYIIPKMFNEIDSNIELFSNYKDFMESEFAYELKTFEHGQQDNQSYTHSVKVAYSPMNLPMDQDINRSVLSESDPTIQFNGLVCQVQGDYQQGGGLIVKKSYDYGPYEYIKYIISRSRDFVSGLSNSEQVKQEIRTMQTDDLDTLLAGSLPTIKKEVNVVFARISDSDDHREQKELFLDSKVITNLVYEHNYMTQLDSIRVGILQYELENGEWQIE